VVSPIGGNGCGSDSGSDGGGFWFLIPSTLVLLFIAGVAIHERRRRPDPAD
jgi:hypothetical protein